jgi:hypothetical protein
MRSMRSMRCGFNYIITHLVPLFCPKGWTSLSGFYAFYVFYAWWFHFPQSGFKWTTDKGLAVKNDYFVHVRMSLTLQVWISSSICIPAFPCVSLVFSAHTSVQLCLSERVSLNTALFDTLYFLGFLINYSSPGTGPDYGK